MKPRNDGVVVPQQELCVSDLQQELPQGLGELLVPLVLQPTDQIPQQAVEQPEGTGPIEAATARAVRAD